MATSLRTLSFVPLLIACVDPYRNDGDDDVADSQVTIDPDDNDDDDSESSDTGPGCQSDDDCMNASLGTVCDESSGQCFAECIPGQSETCYGGPEGTAEIGICKIGSRACQPSGEWPISCDGEVVPAEEDCENGLDDDCDGNVDAADKDGDGFLSCIEGELADCCDDEITDCINAHLVNPGAYEVDGNGVDDDCDDMIDEVDPTCDSGLASNSSNPMVYAQAIDLCATTTEDDANWGVISGEFTLADGGGTPYAPQRSIRQVFGAIEQYGGESMIVLSSGAAAASGQNSPNFAAFEQGTEWNTSVQAPLPISTDLFIPPCPPENAGGDGMANDSIMLSLRIRVPTNARSFTTKMFFFSAEYPEWVCSQYNDFFVALLDSESDENTPDGNIAVFNDQGQLWPIGVNIISVAPDEYFSVCQSGNVGCQGGFALWHECPDGPDGLMGTGFDLADAGESCNGAPFPVGGGTGWLEMSGNVEPGEIVTIQFAIWDGGGFKFDSLVLLDDWQWSLDAASPGVDPIG